MSRRLPFEGLTVVGVEQAVAAPHLRRIEVQTPAGPVCYPAPAPIVIGERRQYGGMLAANGGG